MANQQIDELVELLNRANYEYYVLNDPKLLSDFEFDMKLKELEMLEKETGYVLPYSPTQRVGSDLQDGFGEVSRHRIMGSIANCYDRDELRAWLARFPGETMILEPKYDGSSCSLIYENGILVQASTRGSGFVGTDITVNAKTIRNIPLKLSGDGIPDRIEIRGEILLPKSELKRINEERVSEGLPPFANERNAAAGSLKQLDPSVTASRKLIFKPYSVYCEDVNFTKRNLSSQKDMLDLAHTYGFDAPAYWICDGIESVMEHLDSFENHVLKTQDFCMDGAVVKVNSFDRQEELGYTQKVPHWAKAFKFQQERESTRLKDIVWQMSMQGKLTPVAILEPVMVDGTVISSATLNNTDWIMKLGVRKGSYVFIERNGGVIPGVVGIDYARNDAEQCEIAEFEEPTHCPYCGAELSRRIADGAHLYCVNPDCEEHFLKRLNHFVKKECMDIDGVSEKSLRKLFDAGIVRKWQDLVKLKEIDLYRAGFGPRVSEKMANSIAHSLESNSVEKSLMSLGIPMVGKVTAKEIIDIYGSMGAILDAYRNGTFDISSIGVAVNESFKEYLRDNMAEFTDAVSMLPNVRVEGKTGVPQSDILSGKRVLATGTFDNFSRESIKQSVIDNGGTYASGVNSKLDILIVGREAGPSKLNKARELGIQMIDEGCYMSMIGFSVSATEHVEKTKPQETKVKSTSLF